MNSEGGGGITTDVQEEVKACFECEAAGIRVAMCVPELMARTELMKDERFQIKGHDGKVSPIRRCLLCSRPLAAWWRVSLQSMQ